MDYNDNGSYDGEWKKDKRNGYGKNLNRSIRCT